MLTFESKVHLVSEGDLPKDSSVEEFLESKLLVLYIYKSSGIYSVTSGKYEFDKKEFIYPCKNEADRVIGWELFNDKIKKVLFKDVEDFLKKYLVLVDNDYNSSATFHDKKGKKVYSLTYPHDGTNNKFMLRWGYIKNFDRWANSTEGEIYFDTAFELSSKFKKGKFGVEDAWEINIIMI